jgi:hypothetical protein
MTLSYHHWHGHTGSFLQTKQARCFGCDLSSRNADNVRHCPTRRLN